VTMDFKESKLRLTATNLDKNKGREIRSQKRNSKEVLSKIQEIY